MKILKTLSISFLLGAGIINSSVLANTNTLIINFSEIPAKTICIKHPAAENVTKYFSEATLVSFEVYKAGSKDEVAKIINSLKKDAAVESVIEGKLTGDFQAITISLKTAKNKAWFVSEFKKAGLTNIRINRNPVTEVDKM